MSEVRIICPETLDQEGGRTLYAQVKKANLSKQTEIVLDFGGTRQMDSMGGAWLVQISDLLHRKKAALHMEAQTGPVAEFIGMIAPSLGPNPIAPPRESNMFESLGALVLDGAAEFKQFSGLCVDAIYWTMIAPFEGKGLRWNLVVDEIHEMGVRAVRIVFMMNFLLGLIIAMLSAKQVEAFGIQIYVADLIIIAFARELGAIMTAIVVSARTGAAIAAEIATMKVQEEVDALRGMGLNVTQFLVTPKLLALLIVLPCLSAIGFLAGVLGGTVWGIFVLEFPAQLWWEQTRNAAYLPDFFEGGIKTYFFAAAIAMIGCHNGLRVTGGSRGVGLMTTRAVVMDIFMLIVIDIIFATLFYYVF